MHVFFKKCMNKWIDIKWLIDKKYVKKIIIWKTVFTSLFSVKWRGKMIIINMFVFYQKEDKYRKYAN